MVVRLLVLIFGCAAAGGDLYARTAAQSIALMGSSVNHSHPCSQTARRLRATGLWDRLGASLKAAGSPAVMIFSNAAYHSLLHNFLCALEQKGLGHVLSHVVVWCADSATHAALTNDWKQGGVGVRALLLTEVWEEAVAGDAPFNSAPYAKFAAIKALMPWAAYTLGYDALVQDADVVWSSDVLAYLMQTNTDGAAMADSNRVDTRQRPCRRKEAPFIERFERRRLFNNMKDPLPFSEAACSAYRCSASVNGGFIFARARPGAFGTAIREWASSCGAIYDARENQPSLVAALQGALSPQRGCVYAASTDDDWRRNSTADLLVLNLDLFVSGRPGALARMAHRERGQRGGELLAFHCNFRYGWQSKCEALRNVGMLHLKSKEGMEGNVCKLGSQALRCDTNNLEKCTAGRCARGAFS